MKKTFKYILSLAIIALLTYSRWFSFNIFTNGDWLFIFSNSLAKSSYIYSWFSLADLGSVNIILWRFIFSLSESFIANLGYSLNVSEKILFFWPTIIFANLFGYLLFKKILKSNIASFIATIVFNYNTYYLVIGSGFLIYAATPWLLLSLLIFMKALEAEKKYLFVFSGLTLFVAGSYDFRIAYMGVLLLFAYSLYQIFFIEKLKPSVKALKNLFRSFITFLIFGLLNVYWILPMLKLGSLTSNIILGRGLFGSQFLNVLYAITLFHPFWTGTKSAWFTIEPIAVYFWLIPIFAFLGLWLNRQNKYVLFFGIIALVGIFLTKQEADPFPGIYPWLYTHLIGFNAFREASKFYFLIALGYAVLVGGFISYIFENFKNVRIYFKYALVIFIAGLFLWNIKPFLTGEIGGIFVPRIIPSDYLIVKNFVLKDKEYYRTFWIPSMSTWSIYTTDHPLINMTLALSEYSYWSNSFRSTSASTYTPAELMTMALKLKNSGNVLDISSVKYVFVPTRDIANDEDFFVFYGKSRQYYIDQLNKLVYLKKINIGTKDVVVYENKNYKPHIYTTVEKETISRNVGYKTINYEFINPTEYTFSVKNASSPFYLNFSEGYNPQWNLRVGSFSWIEVLVKGNYFIDDKYHLQNDANLNSYYINPNTICKIQSCKINKDGSYDISGTLYFKPQSYAYLGLVISGGVLISVLCFLLVVFSKILYERKIK
ncbi:MAG TPA: hypothetical protein VMR77_03285 [Patescibacteria group bacterium]|nr:hypothetical protein [Patescibacteria group bacterium]